MNKNPGQVNAARKGAPGGNEGAGIALRKGGRSPKTPGSITKSGKDNVGPQRHNQLTFYTEEAPGVKMEPIWVIVSSAIFVGVVVILHLWGKMQG